MFASFKTRVVFNSPFFFFLSYSAYGNVNECEQGVCNSARLCVCVCARAHVHVSVCESETEAGDHDERRDRQTVMCVWRQ